MFLMGYSIYDKASEELEGKQRFPHQHGEKSIFKSRVVPQLALNPGQMDLFNARKLLTFIIFLKKRHIL